MNLDAQPGSPRSVLDAANATVEPQPAFGAGMDDTRTTFGAVTDDTRTTFGAGTDDVRTTFGAGSDDAEAQFSPTVNEVQARLVTPAPSTTLESISGRLNRGDSVIAGRYIVEREVAGGVEADAYVGRALFDDRVVFIKDLRGFRTDRAAVEKKALMRDRLLRINHPNCVRLLDAEIATERVIEVYEYVDGQSLSKAIAERTELPDRDYVKELTSQIAAAVSHLHELGLAHRDLKPDNIMVSRDAALTLKITDYGTMTSVDEGGKTTFAGTRRYAPPESLRRSLLRDTDLMASDWWSVGRIAQELVDGEHAYDRIAKRFPALVGSEDIQPIFDAILSEQERDVYGVRAGMVEWSAPEWQPLLRGLLTSKRQFRWGYAEVSEWLAGGSPQDAYDTPIDIEPFVFGGRRYDMTSAARVLAQQENWQEAVRQVLEQDGIIRYVKREAQNKRIETRLAALYAFYDALLKQTDEQIADDLCTALALKLIAGDAMPLTINGHILSLELVRKYAADENRLMVWALLSDGFIERVLQVDPTLAAELQDISKEMLAVRDLVASWDANEATKFMWDRMIHFRYASVAELQRVVDTAHREFASTSAEAVNAVYVKETLTDRELATLAWVLQTPEGWNFVTKAEAERQNAERVAERAKALSAAYGWAVVRKYHGCGGILLHTSVNYLFAGIAACLVAAFLSIFHHWWSFVATFYFYSAILLLTFARVLRRTLNQYVIDQVGPGSWFDQTATTATFNRLVAETLGEDMPLNLISQQLDERNRELREFAVKGIEVTPQPKGSPKFGCFAVIGMLVCGLAPIPLNMLISTVAFAFHYLVLPALIVLLAVFFVFLPRWKNDASNRSVARSIAALAT